MCRNSISKRMYEYLSNHIIEVESREAILIEEYYKENVEESIAVEDFFTEYTKGINNFLHTISIDEDNSDYCPIVIIGSTVEVQDLDDMQIYKYRIVYPYSEHTDKNIDYASCMSPLGKAILLKSVNHQANIKIPAGTLHYIIKSVTVEEHLFSEPIIEKELKIRA